MRVLLKKAVLQQLQEECTEDRSLAPSFPSSVTRTPADPATIPVPSSTLSSLLTRLPSPSILPTNLVPSQAPAPVLTSTTPLPNPRPSSDSPPPILFPRVSPPSLYLKTALRGAPQRKTQGDSSFYPGSPHSISTPLTEEMPSFSPSFTSPLFPIPLSGETPSSIARLPSPISSSATTPISSFPMLTPIVGPSPLPHSPPLVSPSSSEYTDSSSTDSHSTSLPHTSSPRIGTISPDRHLLPCPSMPSPSPPSPVLPSTSPLAALFPYSYNVTFPHTDTFPILYPKVVPSSSTVISDEPTTSLPLPSIPMSDRDRVYFIKKN